MKKKNIINLIKYHAMGNEEAFRNEAYEIARYFDKNGDPELAEYIMASLSTANTFVPQVQEVKSDYLEKVNTYDTASLPLPESIMTELKGILNALSHQIGINKFLFQGPPGTGKTESAKQIARITNRELYRVEFETLIDSRLGQTSKNVASLFKALQLLPNPGKVIVLFDEIDALAMDRLNNHDIREMGRVTSGLLKGLDNLDNRLVLIATTNLFKAFDKALIRRFDAVINFDKYTKEDLLQISELILDGLLKQFEKVGRNKRLFRKIMLLMPELPYPGDLKNMLTTALAFSDPNEEFAYLKRLFSIACPNHRELSLGELKDKGFTLREIEVLRGVSKSQISRELKG